MVRDVVASRCAMWGGHSRSGGVHVETTYLTNYLCRSRTGSPERAKWTLCPAQTLTTCHCICIAASSLHCCCGRDHVSAPLPPASLRPRPDRLPQQKLARAPPPPPRRRAAEPSCLDRRVGRGELRDAKNGPTAAEAIPGRITRRTQQTTADAGDETHSCNRVHHQRAGIFSGWG